MRTERKVGCRLIAVIGISLFVLTGRAEDELPEGFRQTEYVQGDGAAYIDLGFKMTETDAVDVVAMMTETGGGLIYGERQSSASHDSHFWGFNSSDGCVILEICDRNIRLELTGPAGDIFAEQRKFIGKKVHCHNSATHRGFYDPDTGAVFASGYESNTALPSDKTFTSENNCGLFTAFGTFWPVDHAFNGRIYSFVITRDGKPFMNLVPCIDESSEEVGFYDTVGEADGKRFYGNTSGQGAFSTSGMSFNYTLTGDFTIKARSENTKHTVPPDIGVMDKDGTLLPSTDYTLKIFDADRTGYATVQATITRGDDAGEYVSRQLPVVFLPSGLKPLEYVQGDGTAYIDLGFKMTEKDAIDVVAMVADDMVTKESGGLIYGTRTSGGSTDTHYWGFNAGDGYVILEFYGNANGMRLSFTGTTDDKFAEQRKFIGKKVHCHNSATHRGFYDPDTGAVFASGYFESKNALPSGKTFTSANNCGLFTAFGTFWSVSHAFSGRIYSFIVTRDGKPFATLVPCIRTRGEKKGEVGFYDAVSGNFVGKTNSSGAFIPGAEVESSSGFAILLK